MITTPKPCPGRSIPPSIIALMLVIAGLTFATDACAQVGSGLSVNVNPVLDPTPLDIEALNLRFNPPKGSSTIAESVDGSYIVTLSDNPKSPLWTMRIQVLKSSQAKATATSQIEDLLKELDRLKTNYRVLENRPQVVAGLTSQLCYLERTTKEGDSVVTGWLVLPLADDQFMVFAMQAVPDTYTSMKPIWETSFATIDMRSQAQVANERNARVYAGQEMLRTFTPEKLKALTGQKQWSRIHKPNGPGKGSTEVGCALIEVFAGKRRPAHAFA